MKDKKHKKVVKNNRVNFITKENTIYNKKLMSVFFIIILLSFIAGGIIDEIKKDNIKDHTLRMSAPVFNIQQSYLSSEIDFNITEISKGKYEVDWRWKDGEFKDLKNQASDCLKVSLDSTCLNSAKTVVDDINWTYCYDVDYYDEMLEKNVTENRCDTKPVLKKIPNFEDCKLNDVKNYTCSGENMIFNYTENPNHAQCYENITYTFFNYSDEFDIFEDIEGINISYLKLVFEREFDWEVGNTIYWNNFYYNNTCNRQELIDEIPNNILELDKYPSKNSQIPIDKDFDFSEDSGSFEFEVPYNVFGYQKIGVLFQLGFFTASFSLDDPSDNIITNDNTPTFNFSLSGNYSSYDVELFVNETGYGTINAINNTWTQITTNASLPDGVYEWYLNATNVTTDQSVVRNIIIDTTDPSIDFVSPTPEEGTTQSADSILINISASDTNNVLVFIDDGSLVGWWRMDDVNSTGEGALVEDYTGVNNGTAVGNAVQGDGRMGKGFVFDGSGDYVKTSSTTGYSSDTGSFAFWVSRNTAWNDGANETLLSTPSEMSVNESGLVGYWRFNNDSSVGENDTLVYDYSGQGNNGTVTDASWNVVGGRYGGAFEFDGDGDYVDVGDDSSLDFGSSTDFSVTGWFKSVGTSDDLQAIMDKRDAGSGEGFLVGLRTDGLHSYINDINGDGNDAHEITSGTDLRDSTWHHFAVTYDKDGDMIIYIDAINKNSTSITDIGDITNGEVLTIGHHTTGISSAWSYFNGSIDEVMIFNRSLSAQEIRRLYLGGIAAHKNEGGLEVSLGNTSMSYDASSWTADEWHSIGGTYSSSGANLYVDGVSVNSTTSCSGFGLTDNETYIGAAWNGTKWNLNGTIDDVMIFNRSLSADEILGLYANSSSKYVSNNFTGLGDGTHSFTAYAQDAGGNVDFSARSVVVDTVNPAVALESPTPGDGTSQSSDAIFVNVSGSDSLSNVSSFIDFDNSLVGWWRMDDVNSTGEGALVEDYTGVNNGTAVGNATQGDGRMGKGFEFDGAGDYVNTNNFADNLSGSTVSIWAKTNSDIPQMMVTKISQISSGKGWALYYSSSKPLFLIQQSGSVYKFRQGPSDITDGTWHHILATKNSSNDLRIYVDGLSVGSDTSSGTVTDFNNANNVIVGWDTDNTADREFNGSIDDVMIFNRSLSADEILGLYANSSSKYVSNNFTSLGDGSHSFTAYAQDAGGNVNSTSRTVVVDSENPNVTLIFPTNNTYNSTTSQNFTANFTDSLGLANATLYIYNETGLYNETNTIFTGKPVKYITGIVVLLVDGVYEWFYKVWDRADNFFQPSYNYTITIDTTPPLINLISPIDETHVSTNQNFTSSLSDINGVTNATLFIYNSTNFLVNNTQFILSNLTSNTIGIVVNLSDGVYNWSYSACDIVGNCNQSINKTLTIDTSSPDITWVNPQESVFEYLNYKNYFNISASVSDTYLDAINLTIYNETNDIIYNNFTQNITTNTISLNDTVNLSEGNNTFEICGRDSLSDSPIIKDVKYKLNKIGIGENNETNILIYNSTNNKARIKRNIQVIDDKGDKVKLPDYNVTLLDEWDNKGKHIKTSILADKFQTEKIGFVINYSCMENCDKLIYLNDRGRERIIDNERNLFFQFDDVDNSIWDVNYAQSGNDVIVRIFPITKSAWESLPSRFLIDPITGGLNNYCENETIRTDTIYPLIKFGDGNSVDFANLSQSSIYVNTTWTELNFANITFTLRNDTETINITTYTTSIYTINWTGLSDGNYTYYVNITDLASNQNSTDIRNIKLDTIFIINISSPEARRYYNNTVVFNLTAEENISTCLFSLDDWEINYTMTINSTYANYTYFGVPEGNYIVRFWCNESLQPNNVNNTEIVNRLIMDAIPQTGLSGATPTPDIISNETMSDIEIAEAESIKFTIELKKWLDEIPAIYHLLKIKLFYIGSLISPQNKQIGVTILAVFSFVIIFLIVRYKEYVEEKFINKAYNKVRKKEKTKKIKYIDNYD